MQNTLEISENDQNAPELNQNTLGLFRFCGYFGLFLLVCLLQRILGHFTHFSSVEEYFLIILHIWGMFGAFIQEVSRFDCSFQPFQGYFGHLRGFRVILLVLEILRLFQSIKWLFWGGGGEGLDILLFQGILEILVILGVYWPFLGFHVK